MISKATRPIEVLALLLCATTASAQDDRGTPEQRAACAPDALRLCTSYILYAGAYVYGKTRAALPERAHGEENGTRRSPI